MSETTKSDKIRQLSQEQMNAIEHLLQGKSDRAVSEAAGVSRQTVWDWRNRDPLFIAELNRQRSEMWQEAHERLKSLANRALDVLEQQLDSGDPKASLAAAKYILQGTRSPEGDGHKMAQKPVFYSGIECQTRGFMDRFKAQAQGLGP